MNNNKLAGGLLVAALALVGANEGIKYAAYQDSVGKWTICNGLTAGVEKGDTATPAYCRDRLVVELLKHSEPLQRVPHHLPDHVVLAWADFCFNVGVGACSGSTGYRMLMQGRISESCPQILRWKFVTVGDQRFDCFLDENRHLCGGIKNRRQLEYKLCAGEITIAETVRQIEAVTGDSLFP